MAHPLPTAWFLLLLLTLLLLPVRLPTACSVACCLQQMVRSRAVAHLCVLTLALLLLILSLLLQGVGAWLQVQTQLTFISNSLGLPSSNCDGECAWHGVAVAVGAVGSCGCWNSR